MESLWQLVACHCQHCSLELIHSAGSDSRDPLHGYQLPGSEPAGSVSATRQHQPHVRVPAPAEMDVATEAVRQHVRPAAGL
jgi:hypothetical protein